MEKWMLRFHALVWFERTFDTREAAEAYLASPGAVYVFGWWVIIPLALMDTDLK